MMRRSAGFSLLELAISMAVTGLIGVSVWKLVSTGTAIAVGGPAQQQLTQSQEAIEGFVVFNNRLPCPAADDSGSETCGTWTNTIGRLPWRTLGLTRPDVVLRYGVYRSATDDLAVSTARLARNLPVDPLAPVVSPVAPLVNGLDLCVALRSAAANPLNSSLTAGGVPAAYALAHPGANRTFEGLNTTTFALQGTPQSSTFDDLNVATGLGELSSRLGCVTRLAEANVSARSAFVAFDQDRNAQTLVDFRNLSYQTRMTDTHYAQAAVGIATVDLAIAVATSVSELYVVAAVPANADVAIAAATVVVAAASLAAAVVGVVQAQAAEEVARLDSVGAATLKTQSAVDLTSAVAAAIVVQKKGLLP